MRSFFTLLALFFAVVTGASTLDTDIPRPVLTMIALLCGAVSTAAIVVDD